jgi:phenylalanyl-tRNA synthetase beta chain
MISGIISGSKYPENWNNNKEMNDFYDVKGNVESLLDLGEITRHHRYVPAQTSCFHPGQCARIESGTGHTIGHVGALHPAISGEMDLSGKIFLFELVLEQVQKAELPKAGRLSRYPEVSRDLAIVIEESVPADAILALVRDQAGEFLTNLRIFDVYQGDAVSKSKKSIALGLTWQHPSRTLSDEEINTIISCCVNALQEQFNANLRD